MRRDVCKRAVLCVFLVIGWIAGGGYQTASAAGQDDSQFPWIGDKGVSIISRSATVREKRACSNKTETIALRGGYSAVACVYGEMGSTRVAAYTNQGGLPVIGIAYPGEEKYSEVYGICEGSACSYSASRDVLVDSRTSRLYTGFAKNLVKMVNPVNGLPYYQFSRSDLNRYVSGSGPMRFNVATVSTNGKWAVVEVYEHGFVRVDLDTFHQRRIAVSGAQYGLMNDPHFELAISNSGRDFAVVGEKTGISVYQIDNYCGDVLSPQSSYYFVTPSVPCRISSYNTGYFPGFLVAYSPVFNNDGTQLGLTVQTIIKRERIIASPSQTITNNGERLQYMALGDSYTSGEGETSNKFYKTGTDTEGNKCHLSSRSYPYLVGINQGLSRMQSLACSGAQMNDIFGTTMYFGQKNQVPKDEQNKIISEYQALDGFMPGVVRQLDFVSKYQPKTVTIGIGGNDAGLMDKLTTCIGPGVCEWVKNPAMRLASAKEIQRLYGSIRSVIASLKTTSPDTKIMFVGYPKIINEAMSAQCSPVLGVMLSSEERQFMDESIKVLNDTVRAAALSEGSKFIDIQDAFVGHRLCEGDAKAMNGIRGGDDIAPIQRLSILKLIGSESFHPTPFGHTLIANQFVAKAPNLTGTDFDCPECTVTEPRPLSSYWTSGTDSSQIKKSMKGSVGPEVATVGQRISIIIPQQFRPQSTVTIELHSDLKQLGQITTDQTGKGEVDTTIPLDTVSGYHTLHLFGESWVGEPLDVYQVIAVVNPDDEEALGGTGTDSKVSEIIGLANTPKLANMATAMKRQSLAEFSLATIVPSVLGSQDGASKTNGVLDNSSKRVVDEGVVTRALTPLNTIGILVGAAICCIGVITGCLLLRRHINHHLP